MQRYNFIKKQPRTWELWAELFPQNFNILKMGEAMERNGKPSRNAVLQSYEPGMAFYRWKLKSQKKVSKKIHLSIIFFFPTTGISTLRHQWAKVRIFFTQQAYPQTALKLSLLFWEGYHKGKKNKNLSLCHNPSAAWKGCLHLEELKEAFDTVHKTKGEDQTSEKEEGTAEEILKD